MCRAEEWGVSKYMTNRTETEEIGQQIYVVFWDKALWEKKKVCLSEHHLLTFLQILCGLGLELEETFEDTDCLRQFVPRIEQLLKDLSIKLKDEHYVILV